MTKSSGVEGGASSLLLPYVEKAKFDPRQYAAIVWPRNTKHNVFNVGGGWYNPGIAILSEKDRKELSSVYTKIITYLVTFKRNLYVGGCIPLTDSTSTNYSHKNQQSFILVDNEMQPVWPELRIDDENSDPSILKLIKSCEDIRLESFDQQQDENYEILGHCHIYNHNVKFVYLFFQISITNSSTIRVSRLDHPEVSMESLINYRVQNIGILWNGKKGNHFEFIEWPRLDTLDVRRGIPPIKRQEQQKFKSGNNGFILAEIDNTTKRVHGTGSPIDLADICPGTMLLIGHVHLDSALHHHAFHSYDFKKPKKNVTLFGNTYLFNFILSQNTSPFKTLASSTTFFCFPSLTDNSNDLCDIIQFITGFIRIGQNKVLITYGINDCQSAWLEISIHSLLSSIGFNSSLLSSVCSLSLATANIIHQP